MCHFSTELGNTPLEFSDVVSDRLKVCFRQVCGLPLFNHLFLLFLFRTLVFLVDEPPLDISHPLLEGAYMGHSPAFQFFKAFGDN